MSHRAAGFFILWLLAQPAAAQPLQLPTAPASRVEAIIGVAATAPCQAVFVSCTNARTLDIIEPAEQRLGIPVLSSTQALAWHMLRLAGLEDRRSGYGQLFAT